MRRPIIQFRGNGKAIGSGVCVMAEPHVVSALLAKRAEISGYIRDLENKIKRQRVNLAHIDATIQVFSPDLNLDSIPLKRRYQRSRYFAKGEISRTVLDALRKANGQPIKAAAIVNGLIAEKGFRPDDTALVESVTERVLTVLRRLSKQGAVIKSGVSRDAQWKAQKDSL